MLVCNSRLGRRLAALFTVLASTVLIMPLQGQQFGKVLGSREDTEIPFLKGKDRFTKLVNAEVMPDAVADKALLEVAGRYYIYRVTWPTNIQSDKWETGMGRLQGEFEKLMSEPATKEGKNKEFMKLLAHQLIGCLKNVLVQQKYETGTSTAMTNAALMLPVLARCKQPEVIDFLLELTKTDNKGNGPVHPFVRMCAVKGLGEWNNPVGPIVDAGKGRRDLERAEALMQFIDLPYPPQGKGQEFDDAVAYVRREGVKALAQAPVPAVEAAKDKVRGPVAYYLLKVASGSPAQSGPPFTLSEKLEAAIGACQLKPAAARYNVELTAFVVAKVLAEFAEAYVEDYQYFSVKQDTKDKDVPKHQAKLPWSLYAVRLDLGLNAMAAGMPKDSPAAPKFRSLVTNTKKMLDTMAKRKEIEPPGALAQDVAALQPATLEVYEGHKDYMLPLTAK